MNRKISPQSIFLILIGLTAVLFLVSSLINLRSKNDRSHDPNQEPQQEQENLIEREPTSLGKEITIDNENLTGSYSEILGESVAAKSAREYIKKKESELQTQADTDLPEMRKEFPDAFADRKYALEIDANILSSDNTQSIVLLEYVYTGGANGNSLYTSFTQDDEGNMLTLKDVVPYDKHEAFMSLVKQRLREYELPEGEKVDLFPESINELTFAHLKNFALENDDLNIYFDKYEVGPGVVGPIVLTISNIKETLATMS